MAWLLDIPLRTTVFLPIIRGSMVNEIYGENSDMIHYRADSTVYIYRVLLSRIIRDLPKSGDSEVIIGVLVIK